MEGQHMPVHGSDVVPKGCGLKADIRKAEVDEQVITKQPRRGEGNSDEYVHNV